MLQKREYDIRSRLKSEFPHYARKCLKIRSKAGQVEPFEMNEAQQFLHHAIEEQYAETGKVRVLILKGRQQGCSTYVEGRFYWKVSHRKGVRAFILTHEQKATDNLFEMANRYHNNCPKLVRPTTGTSNAKELAFPKLDSGYAVGTAGTKEVGRSSTIQYFHGSEVAFWANADTHSKGVIQAIPDMPGTEVILESTANGIGNYFHLQWQMAVAGLSDYIAIFIPWFWQSEYRKPVPEGFVPTDEETELMSLYGLDEGQLVWRRTKVIELTADGVEGAKAFKQEYPNTAAEAFQVTGEDSFIQPDDVTPARQGGAERYGPLILGVDPARFGDDRVSFIWRQGRVAFGLKSFKKKDTMEIAGMTHRLIQKSNKLGRPVQRVFVDVNGLGAGVVDRLHELGYKDLVRGINGAERAFDPNRYANKRAEMWGEMKEWILDRPVQIPDSDSLHADLCAPAAKTDSKSRMLMEKKDDMKKRGLRSPDEGDALALTFAEPVVNELTHDVQPYIPADSDIGF